MDIHPKDKKIVGERLALLARHYVYGEDVPCDPPRVGDVCQISGNTIELSFENTYGSLHVRGERGEALKVYDEQCPVSFETQIEEDRLQISLPENRVCGRIRIEFAREKWYLVNLYNAAELPMIPFALEMHLRPSDGHPSFV